MRVTFRKIEDKGRRWCRWDAVRGKRTCVPGTTMGVGNDIPHDLAQYVIEASVGFEDGFWGCVAKGATFKSTGRRRTRPGRAVIAEHRVQLDRSERLAGAHLAAWRRQEPTAVSEALDDAMQQWKQLRGGDSMVFIWPSARGATERAADTAADGP